MLPSKHRAQIFLADRGKGKTTRLIEWVKQGERTNYYPGWSRIILVPAFHDAQRLRHGHNVYGLDYHQVFTVSEFRDGKFPSPGVEIGVDNIDLILHSYLGGAVTVGTMTGEHWT